MKRGIHIVLMLVCLVPLLSSAREESMEERRQRIMRRYLRNRSSIAQSDLEVPVPRTDDELLAETEQRKKSQIDLQRQEGGSSMPPPPPPRRPPPMTQNRNWLLDIDPLVTDPFAPANDTQETPDKKADWTTWGKEDDSPYGGVKYESWFNRKKKEEPVVNGNRSGSSQEGIYPARGGYNPFSFGGNSFGSQQKETVPPGGNPGLFGRKQESSFGSRGLSQEQRNDLNQQQGILQSPFMRRSGGLPGSESKGQQGYVPYKSLYETRSEQQKKKQQQQWGGQTQQENEYQKVNPYQEWKKRTSVYDPAGNNAFINEHMPKSKR